MMSFKGMLLSFFFCLFTSQWSFANSNLISTIDNDYNFSIEENKIYVDSKDVKINKKGIFVKINDHVFKTPSIFCDDEGTYLYGFSLVICPDCGRDYPSYEGQCPYSGTHDDDNSNDE